jgi:hypothetical protein
VNRNRNQPDPGRLEPLAAQAKDYALHMMRTTGAVPPTVIADTDDGYVFCMPTSLTDDAAKDRFAEVARLFAIAHQANALVLIVEAWAKLPDATGHLDTTTPPSQSPDRKEVVALMLEDHSRCATSLVPITRDESGKFSSFGSVAPLDFGESAGRFSNLMPRNQPTSSDAAKAKAALQSLGLEIINRGFDPTLN